MANEMYAYPSQAFNGTNPYMNPGPNYQRQSQIPMDNNGGLMTILVNTEEEVGFYPVAAGVTVLLVSFNLKKFWLKSTGKNGVPEPLRSFSFEEEISPEQDSNYATKEDFKSLNDKLDKLISELGGTK